MLTLYHLSISHFSEKARWCLDHKGLEYRSRLLMPAYHILTVRRVAGSSTVPVLTDSETGAVVSDSTDIIHFLERLCPDPSLLPEDPDLAADAMQIEEFFDEHCARHVAGYLYHFILDYPSLLEANWTHGLGGGQRMLVRAALPIVRRQMRRVRNINATTAAAHRVKVFEALDRLREWIDASPTDFLVGESFGAADLTAATLLGPAVRPAGSPWDAARRELAGLPPGFPPQQLAEFWAEVAAHPASAWVQWIWERHRRRAATQVAIA